MSKKSNTFQILHISDLHVSTDKEFDRKVVLDPLLDRVRKDRQQDLQYRISLCQELVFELLHFYPSIPQGKPFRYLRAGRFDIAVKILRVIPQDDLLGMNPQGDSSIPQHELQKE